MAQTTIDAYLATLPVDQRAALERVRREVKSLVPDAEEVFAYGMPGFHYQGKPLAYYGGWKNHCAVYGLDASLRTGEELRRFPAAKGTIRFSPSDPLPADLVARLVQARLEAIGSETL